MLSYWNVSKRANVFRHFLSNLSILNEQKFKQFIELTKFSCNKINQFLHIYIVYLDSF